MRLAAAEVNSRGVLLGRGLRIAAADSRSKPAAVARAVRRLIEDEPGRDRCLSASSA
jgi:ABC-type branched-subunit amino acid transport system substrate-binding protein